MASLFVEAQHLRATAVTAANLLASAVKPSPPAHWQEGFSWRSELCPAWALFDPCGEGPDVPTDGSSGVVYCRPVAFRVEDDCIVRNVTFDIDRVRRMAEATTSSALAAELWTGTATQAEPYSTPDGLGGTASDVVNPYLAGPTAEVISDAVADPMEALGLLEERARQAAGGQQVFLHVPNRITTQLGAQLRRVGNLIYTQTDAVVVGDPGYPGTGPDGDEGTAPGVWCYATGPVVAYVDTLETIDAAEITVDRRTNRRTVWAQRMISATFDPCCHFAIELNAPADA
jgi:hypothetical protein